MSAHSLADPSDRSHELLEGVKALESRRVSEGLSTFELHDLAARVGQLVHSVVGSRSSYADSLRLALKAKTTTTQYLSVVGVLQAFHHDLLAGHLIDLRQEAEAIVVSEILSQAAKLIRTKGVHPAAAIIVACAGLEEFLRNWCVQKGVVVAERSRSIAAFAAGLRKDGALALPEERRVLSWADYRNDAAHGDKWNTITAAIGATLVTEITAFVADNSRVLT